MYTPSLVIYLNRGIFDSLPPSPSSPEPKVVQSKPQIARTPWIVRAEPILRVTRNSSRWGAERGKPNGLAETTQRTRAASSRCPREGRASGPDTLPGTTNRSTGLASKPSGGASRTSRCHGVMVSWGTSSELSRAGAEPMPPALVATGAFSTGLPRFSLPAPHRAPYCDFPFRPGPRSWYSTATADYTQSGGTSLPWSSGCGGGGKEAKLARSWHDLRSDSWTSSGKSEQPDIPPDPRPLTKNSPLRWLVPIQDRTEQLPGRWRVCYIRSPSNG